MVISEDQAKELQIAIEKTFRKKLSFDIRSGDIVLGEFTNLPKVGKAKRVWLEIDRNINRLGFMEIYGKN